MATAALGTPGDVKLEFRNPNFAPLALSETKSGPDGLLTDPQQ